MRAASMVRSLAAIAPVFTAAAGRDKLRLLDRLARLPLRDPGALRLLHETLCYLQAYPDDARVLGRVDAALASIAARVGALGRGAEALSDTGIAGTALDYPFGLPMTRWLVGRFPRDTDVAPDGVPDPEALQETLPALTQGVEEEALTDEGGLGWRRWLELTRRGPGQSDLAILVDLFDRAPLPAAARDRLFESLGLSVAWRLGDGAGSRTRARLPWPRPFFHGGREPAIYRPDAGQFARELTGPPPVLRRAPRALAERLIDAARAAMATRQRELFAFSHANAGDVLVHDAGRGVRVALIGIAPAHRLPLHAYYAYLALKNGVPVSYGAGWQLFGVLEAALNVFESFRGGESAFVAAQALRAYRSAFGMRAITLDAYQIGRDNAEALAAGAFYFYDRLGFRPRDPRVEALARAERAKIAARPDHRSPPRVLRRLAASDMRLDLDGARVADPPPASRLAALVTRHIARRFGGDRAAAERDATARVARAVGARDWQRWPAERRHGFAQLALVAALIPGLEGWTPSERGALLEVMRAKGGPSEAAYARRLGAHPRLQRALAALAAAPRTAAVTAPRPRSRSAR
jgi:hypothetical protein